MTSPPGPSSSFLRNVLQTTNITPGDEVEVWWPHPSPRVGCCVPGCSNSERQNPGKVFYAFPTEESTRRRWLKQINRTDLTEQQLTAGPNSNRVCSDHFAPSAYNYRGSLHRDGIPTLKLRDETIIIESAKTPLKRKSPPDEKLTKKRRNNPNITDESCGSQTFIEPNSMDIGIHDMEIQCQDPLAIKPEPGIQHVATQTFTRKELFLSIASLTGSEQLDLPQVFSEPVLPLPRTVQTQTTVNLIASYTTPVKKQLQAQLKEINKKIRKASDAHMDNNRFMLCCESYLNERVVKVVKSHSNTQERYVGNRYGHEFKSFAVNLYRTNPQCYKFVESIFNLPSTKTLQRVQVPARTGTNEHLFEYLKVKVSKMPEKEKVCAICFDVLRISKNLWYEVSNDFLCGMHEIDQVMGPEPAQYAGILVLRGLYTNWKQPVSFAFMTDRTQYPELNAWLHKIIGIMFDIGLNVKAFVADLDNEFMDVSVASETEHHFEINGRKIYRFYDVRHLFKSVRDAFMEYNFHFGEKVAKWNHILKVYNKDKDHDFSLMPKITDDHVHPGADVLDNVNMATELFSNQVAAAMNFFISANMADQKTKDTVEFILNMSKYFDLLNSKTLSTAYIATEQQNRLVSDLLKYLGLMEVIDKRMRYTEFQFVTGLVVNLKSLASLSEDLKEENFQYILTKCLSKECAEEFFEECRRLGGNCCERPTAVMFTRSFRRLFLNNLVIKNGENQQDLQSTLYKMGEYDLGKKDERECENLQINGIGDIKIKWPSNEYMAGYILCRCLEKHKCVPFITKLSSHYEIPFENDAATLIKKFKKYNAENINSSHLIKPPDYLVDFVNLLDQKYLEYNSNPSLESVNYGWNLYKNIEADSFDLPCQCFPLKFMKMLFIRMKLEYYIRGHNKENKNARKPRHQQMKKQGSKKSK